MIYAMSIHEHENDTYQMVRMYVYFKDLGLSSSHLRASMSCKGKCSSTQRRKFPNGSLFITLLEDLGPISVLLFDKNNNAVQKKFDDMVVKECG